MNGVCSLGSGVGDREGMVDAAMVVLFGSMCEEDYHHCAHRRRFGGFIHDCSGL